MGFFGSKPQFAVDLASAVVLPHDRHLSDQLDRLRDGAKGADPDLSLRLFNSFLDSLPADAGAVIRMRVKANIGLQHLARGDGKEAVRWLVESSEEAPDDPRSVANRTLALWLGGDAEGAYRFGRERLAADPTNETLASYLPQIAVMVPDVVDGLDGIPDALRETESVTVGQSVFLRGRDIRPDWWEWARSSSPRFPGSEHLKLLAAFSHLDEIARDEEAQRSQVFSSEQRERLAKVAATLDADWQARPWLLKNRYDDAPHTLAGAMVAHQLLHDRATALARAERIADEGLDYPDILLNAVMTALSYGEIKLAERLIALAPDDPELAFHSAVIAVQKGDWTAAAAILNRAKVPEGERRVAETLVALAPIKAAGRPGDGSTADPAPLEALLDATRDSPRGLILIARVAADLDLIDLSERAFEAAVKAVPADSHIATRLMVAAYAERANSPATLIRILDGHLPFEGFDVEHERLAVAHANERPHRQRNLAYFDALPIVLRGQHGISRAHASVLLDVGKVPEAVKLMRRLHGEDPSDAYVTIRLVDALRLSKDPAGASSILRRLDLPASVGPPELVMVLAHQLMREGCADRAYPVAYDLVRRHAGNAQVVLGYAALGLFLQAPNPMFAAPVAGAGTCVTIEGPDGIRQSFIIDTGGDFFGMSVLPPAAGIAERVTGLRRGDTFALAKLGSDPETWTVAEVTSKYLHLQHRVLEQFETRFPDKPGIARYTVGEDNIDAVLEMVRRSAEQNARNARTYLEQPIPLSIVARGLGGEVVSFAQFIRRLDGQIITCAGSEQERVDGIGLAGRYKALGAVLDPYTAWVAAEIGVLPDLKAWFGTLRTPASTIAMIDRMIDRENEGRGREQMTLSWHQGRFYRDEVTDEYRDGQISALTRVRDTIAEHCDVVSVLIPDEISDVAETMVGMAGSRFLDAAFLASDTASILVSDDMRYRQWSSEAVGCEGIWLQAALLAAVQGRTIKPKDYARSVAGLAAHGHTHVAFSGLVLYLIASQDSDGFPGLRATLRFLAGPTAEMVSHRAVFQNFLDWLWPPDDTLPLLKTKAATGLALEAFLTDRKWDWLPLLEEVVRKNRGDPLLSKYLASWLHGHFITAEAFAGSLASSGPAPAIYRPARGRRRKKRARSDR